MHLVLIYRPGVFVSWLIKINMLLRGGAGGKMLVSNTYHVNQDIFEGKSQAVRDLYGLLVAELNKFGPVQEIKKAISISLENGRPFASVLIRNRSLKLVLRTEHRITNQRILSIDRVANKSFDHTVLLDSKDDINDELKKWLGEAYHANS
jgi:hypothetical protein